MKRIYLKPPKQQKTKGLWIQKKIGTKMRLIPSCICSKVHKKYCKQTTRNFLLWEAHLILNK